jgi:hypothetical protein
LKSRDQISADLHRLVSLRVEEYLLAGRPSDDDTKIETIKLLNRYCRKTLSECPKDQRKKLINDIPGVDLDIIDNELDVKLRWR